MVTLMFLGKYSKGASILLIHEEERGMLIIKVFKDRKFFFFIFTTNFIEQRIHSFVPLPCAIFQATS